MTPAKTEAFSPRQIFYLLLSTNGIMALPILSILFNKFNPPPCTFHRNTSLSAKLLPFPKTTPKIFRYASPHTKQRNRPLCFSGYINVSVKKILFFIQKTNSLLDFQKYPTIFKPLQTKNRGSKQKTKGVYISIP